MFNMRLFFSTILVAVFMMLFTLGDLLPSEIDATSAKASIGGRPYTCCEIYVCNSIKPVCGSNNYGVVECFILESWECEMETSNNPCNHEADPACQGKYSVSGDLCPN